MPATGRPIVIIDRYTFKPLAEYPSVKEAAKDLSIPESTIYQCIQKKAPSYDSYFMYKYQADKWTPAPRIWMRVNGIKVCEKLEELRKEAYNDR